MSWRSRGTLRLRITAVAVTVVVAVLLVTSVALTSAQHEMLQSTLDAALVERADELAIEVAATPGWPPDLVVPADEDVAWQVLDDGGAVVASSAGLRGAPPLATGADAGSSGTVVTRSGPPLDEEAFPYRQLARRLDQGQGLVLVAGDLEDVFASTRTLTSLLVVAIPVVAAILAVLVWVLVGRTLRPVEDIRATVAGIGAGSLDQRVPRPPGDDEIARLADTMNAMLDRIEDSTRRQQRFVADASHELRTPLTRLRARLELLVAATEHRRRTAPAVDRDVPLRDALADAIALQHLADDLLAVARADAPTDGERPVPVDLDDIVLREARRVRGSGRVLVDTSAVSAAGIVGEPSGLTRVVRNLIENAERHATSRVTLSLVEVDRVAILAVADDGPGIPATDHERIFERFARLDAARSRDAGGAGLGLAIVREIVARHGGSVVVDAGHAPGARFVVTLPLAAA